MGTYGTIFTIIFVIIWVVKGLASMTGNDEQAGGQGRQKESRGMDANEARRRQADMAQQSRRADHQSTQVNRPAEDVNIGAGYGQQPTPQQLSQMTMAQRIELARQRARQETMGGSGQNDEAAEALRRARAHAEQEARRNQQATEEQLAVRRNVAREQAERRQALQAREQRDAARRKAAEQREQAERIERQRTRAQRKAKANRPRQAKSAKLDKPSSMVTRSSAARSESYKRVHKGHADSEPVVMDLSHEDAQPSTAIGPLTKASLRRAIIMKELLDKPVALRNEPSELLS